MDDVRVAMGLLWPPLKIFRLHLLLSSASRGLTVFSRLRLYPAHSNWSELLSSQIIARKIRASDVRLWKINEKRSINKRDCGYQKPSGKPVGKTNPGLSVSLHLQSEEEVDATQGSSPVSAGHGNE